MADAFGGQQVNRIWTRVAGELVGDVIVCRYFWHLEECRMIAGEN